MEIIYILVPLSVLLVGVAVGIFMWAVNSGQFEDLDTPAWRILRDEQPRATPSADGERKETGHAG